MYDFKKQGVDYPKVALLFLKWPVYAFRLLRRGRFETIAELRSDAYKMDKLVHDHHHRSDGSRSRFDSNPDLLVGVHHTLTSPRTALGWAGFLLLVLFADHFLLVPQLRGVVATLLAGSSFLTILVMLSSITRESTSASSSASSSSSSMWLSNVMGGVFFLASTFPFAMPWIVAFFFPRQCLLFFSTWALFGAVIGEVSVLVSRARLDAATSRAKKDLLEDDAVSSPSTSTAQVSFSADTTSTQRVRPQALRKRTRKTTEQRIATTKNFTVDDRRDLEDYLVSDEGVRWWAAFLAMQGCVAGTAVFLRLVSDVFFPNNSVATAVLLLLSLCLFCESFWMTYAAGGRWLHFRKQWRFFQPMLGGQRFVFFQCIAWFLFFVFLLKTLSDLRPAFHVASLELAERSDDGDGEVVVHWGLVFLDEWVFAFGDWMCRLALLDKVVPYGAVALCGILAELFLMVSLPLFEGKDDAAYLEQVLDGALEDVLRDEDHAPAPPAPVNKAQEAEDQMWQEIQDSMLSQQRMLAKSQFSVSFWELCADALRTAWLSPIVLTLVKPEVVLFLLSFLMTKFVHGMQLGNSGITVHLPYVFIVLELLYLPTFAGMPRRTGRRRWWSIRGSWVYDELSAYWYSNIIRERELNANHKHIFGYHPHGLFPMGAMYIHNTSQWLNLFPDIAPYSLTATVTHIVPLLKDVTQYLGGLEVSQNSFSNALMKFHNVLLVPGGQHEMLLGGGDGDGNQVLLSSKHKGFVRLALETARDNPDETINLVPIYAFGEIDMVYNGFPISLSLQRWLVSKLRLNPAFLPVGRFNLAGVPRRVPVTFCVGSPARVPVVVGGEITDQHVDLLAQRYYSAVDETFEKHKKLVAGFDSSYITFVPELPLMSRQEFEAKWMQLEQELEQKAKLQLQEEETTTGEAAAGHKKKRKSKDPFPYAEYAVAFVLGNLTIFTPYFFFAATATPA